MNLIITALLSILSSIIAVISLLYLREYRLRQKEQHKKAEVDEETRKKSMELLNAAQQAETGILSESSVLTKQIEAQFQAKLDQILHEFSTYLSELKNTAASSQLQSQKSVEERINEMFERLETRLSGFLIKTEQNTTSSIELELRSARNLIESYKTKQLALIDENILAMMEQTLNIVLSKKLNLKDQLDLIYEALEKAKIEKFLV